MVLCPAQSYNGIYIKLMTKKDYIKIAEFLKSVKPDNVETKYFIPVGRIGMATTNLTVELSYFMWVVNELIKELKADNDKFDEDKFRKAIYK